MAATRASGRCTASATRSSTAGRGRSSSRSTATRGWRTGIPPALRPDVSVIHAQEADRDGNVQLWGIPGVQKEAILAADRSLVTVERIVDELELRPGGVIIPGWVIDAVALAPGGSRPSYSHGMTTRDNDFYRAWDEIARDRERFTAWMHEHVLDGSGEQLGAPAGKA